MRSDAYDRMIKITIACTAVAMSLYHLYVAFTGAPEAFFFRGTHLLFALALVFLLYPSFARKPAVEDQIRDDAGGVIGAKAGTASWLDWLLIGVSAVTIGYVWWNHEHLITRFVFVEDPETVELIEHAGCAFGRIDFTHDVCKEIRYYESGTVGYLHFDFYNGAMNSAQCRRLQHMLSQV